MKSVKFQQKNRLQELIKMKKRLQKNVSYTLQFIDSGKCMAGLSNLLIIYLKDFIKLNVNQDMAVKNVKQVELNINISNATVLLNIQTLKII